MNAREYALNATVDQDFVDLMEQLRNLMSHAIPGGELVEVIRRAMQIAVEEWLRKKAAKVKRPRHFESDTEDISADVKRAVWDRDEGCCAWKHDDGRICRSRWMLEFDHIVAQARGGLSTVENVRLLCRDHNQQHARDVFGVDFMKRKRAKA